MNNYEDIINLPHHQSSTRKHMSISDRAAQFAPFAALTGYDSAISETGRMTDRRRELSESELDVLNDKLNYIKEHLDDEPEITVSYFQPDSRKSGGAYLGYTGTVKRIDDYEGVILFQSGKKILMDDVNDIESDVFKVFEE